MPGSDKVTPSMRQHSQSHCLQILLTSVSFTVKLSNEALTGTLTGDARDAIAHVPMVGSTTLAARQNVKFCSLSHTRARRHSQRENAHHDY